MKKVLWLIVCLMTMVIGLSSCSMKTYEVTANYDVCYPDGTKNYDETTTIKCSTKPSVVCYSVFGTNYISISNVEKNVYGQKTAEKLDHFKSSTSPMRLNKYSVIEVKKRKRQTYGGDIYMSDILSH